MRLAFWFDVELAQHVRTESADLLPIPNGLVQCTGREAGHLPTGW